MAWPAGAQAIGGMAVTQDGALYVTLGGAGSIGSGITGAQAGAQSIQAPFVLAKWGIPFIPATTGTMGNNGAVSGMTALGTTYSGGAWLYLPAGAVAAGVPAAAAWLWFVASSATAGTVFNSTYTTGTPTLGTATAFATTGPGAFTGVTTQIIGPQITIPANSLSASGQLLAEGEYTNNGGTAGTHLMGMVIGGTEFGGNTFASVTPQRYLAKIANSGATNVNYGTSGGVGPTNSILGAAHYTAIDFTVAQTFQFKYTRGTATENYVMERGEIVVVY